MVVVTGSAQAHDFWIEPSSFHPQPGDSVPIGLRVGEQFKGEPVTRNPAKIDRFIAIAPDGKEHPIAGTEGAEPAGNLQVDRLGIYLVGFRSRRSSIELEAAKFEEYLKEEGLSRISVLRAQRGETEKPGKEVYSRAAKAILRVGDGSESGFDRPLGFTFEIVPQRNPYGLRPGQDDLPLIVLYENKPAEGMEVFAMNQGDSSKVLSAQSDKDGKVSFRLPTSGVWMIKAIHMASAPPDTQADWESVWATLTFEMSSEKPKSQR